MLYSSSDDLVVLNVRWAFCEDFIAKNFGKNKEFWSLWQFLFGQMERDYDTPEGKEGADDEAYMMPMEQRDPMMWI